jgi:hypothetical protein
MTYVDRLLRGTASPRSRLRPVVAARRATVVWRELQWYVTVVVRTLEWLGAALIVWGCAVACLNPQADLRSSRRRLASTPKREVRWHARQGIHEIEAYLAGHDHHC